jgi:excisionase family DNA binding protein
MRRVLDNMAAAMRKVARLTDSPDLRSATRRGLLSVDEAAQYLGVSSGTLRNWMSMRRVEFVKIGRLSKLTQSGLDRYIAAHTVRTVEPDEPL